MKIIFLILFAIIFYNLFNVREMMTTMDQKISVRKHTSIIENHQKEMEDISKKIYTLSDTISKNKKKKAELSTAMDELLCVRDYKEYCK